MEIVSWSPGDNGRSLTPTKTEHAFFTSKPNSTPATQATPASFGKPAAPVAAAPAPFVAAPSAPAAPVEDAAVAAATAALGKDQSSAPAQASGGFSYLDNL